MGENSSNFFNAGMTKKIGTKNTMYLYCNSNVSVQTLLMDVSN